MNEVRLSVPIRANESLKTGYRNALLHPQLALGRTDRLQCCARRRALPKDRQSSRHLPVFARNGLLLRADLHRLFDTGYITVNRELVLEVGARLRADYENGRSYYPLDGARLRVPRTAADSSSSGTTGKSSGVRRGLGFSRGYAQRTARVPQPASVGATFARIDKTRAASFSAFEWPMRRSRSTLICMSSTARAKSPASS
jgi:hypothetical protein